MSEYRGDEQWAWNESRRRDELREAARLKEQARPRPRPRREAPKWLRPGMLVEARQHPRKACRGEPALVLDSATAPGIVLLAGADGETWHERVADLKPYVPRFNPGDRVIVATTGEAGTVCQADHDPARGVVAVRLDSHTLAHFKVSAHLLAKLEEEGS